MLKDLMVLFVLNVVFQMGFLLTAGHNIGWLGAGLTGAAIGILYTVYLKPFLSSFSTSSEG